MYVYLRSKNSKTNVEKFEVGFYAGTSFYIESVHSNPQEAAQRVHYLNGGPGSWVMAPDSKYVGRWNGWEE